MWNTTNTHIYACGNVCKYVYVYIYIIYQIFCIYECMHLCVYVCGEAMLVNKTIVCIHNNGKNGKNVFACIYLYLKASQVHISDKPQKHTYIYLLS